MLDRIDALRRELDTETLDSEEAAEAFRVKYLGRRQGQITNLFKKIGGAPPEERPKVGQALNALKARAEERLEEAHERLAHPDRDRDASAGIDLTLPGRRPFSGSLHPLTQTLGEITRIFERFGFDVARGPEIEDDWHNFTALNFPPDHPARDMQDTFFLERNENASDVEERKFPREQVHDEEEDVVLRTHTSPVQIRVMEHQKPPVRVIVPGRVYRNEALSYKSYCLFHQVEGLYVDEGVTMGDLKQTLTLFAQAFFGADVKMRFRPSFFPFTEPSAEVDIWWMDPDDPESGQWLEILGCGMVHPNVLEAVDIDPERYTGYAFGLGVERPAMLRYGINDIRVFYENDVRFLKQF